MSQDTPGLATLGASIRFYTVDLQLSPSGSSTLPSKHKVLSMPQLVRQMEKAIFYYFQVLASILPGLLSSSPHTAEMTM